MSAPLNAAYNKVFTAGGQTMQFSLGGRLHLTDNPGDPEAAIRTGLTLLFPK